LQGGFPAPTTGNLEFKELSSSSRECCQRPCFCLFACISPPLLAARWSCRRRPRRTTTPRCILSTPEMSTSSRNCRRRQNRTRRPRKGTWRSAWPGKACARPLRSPWRSPIQIDRSSNSAPSSALLSPATACLSRRAYSSRSAKTRRRSGRRPSSIGTVLGPLSRPRRSALAWRSGRPIPTPPTTRRSACCMRRSWRACCPTARPGSPIRRQSGRVRRPFQDRYRGRQEGRRD
jgi:hypothetical protein